MTNGTPKQMLITVTNSLVKNTHKSYKKKNPNLTFITNMPHFLWLQRAAGSIYCIVYPNLLSML